MLVCVCVQVVEMNEALLANNVKASVRASPEEGEQERERERDWGSEMARTEAGREIQNFPIGKHIQHGVKEFRLPFFAY